MKPIPKSLQITKVQLVGPLTLEITFSDKTRQVIDFGPFLRGSLHPESKKFSAPKKFSRFTLKEGELMWGDYDLIFPVADLYRNRIGDVNTPSTTRKRDRAKKKAA